LERIMRPVACVLLVLFVLGLVASVAPLAPPTQPGEGTPPWRRTVDGWERAAWLDHAAPIGRAGLHPLLFAAGELILAIGLPVALSKTPAGGTGRPGYGRAADPPPAQ
jgi:hypothetical protein